jgi:glycosyltransferase involved in cell wall biosynthesis
MKIMLSKFLAFYREHGLKNVFYRSVEKIIDKASGNTRIVGKQTNLLDGVEIVYEPTISVVVPVYNTPEIFLKEMIESVLLQSYPNFQLCIFNGGSTDPIIDAIIQEYVLNDKRIFYNKGVINEGISKNTNNAILMAKGEYIALLDHDDLLTKDALLECVKAINFSNPDVIYSDEDKVTADGKTFLQPHYKPDWSPDTLRSYNYICHFLVIKSETLSKVGYFREGFDGSQDYDLVLRLSTITNSIYHIPKILYHWRMSVNSTAGNSNNKNYAFDAGKKALEDHLNNIGLKAKVTRGDFPGAYDLKYYQIKNSGITIIATGEWQSDNKITKYYNELSQKIEMQNYELIIINKYSSNSISHERRWRINQNTLVIYSCNYIREINNHMKNAANEYILLITENIRILEKDWLEVMMLNAQTENTVIVGSKIIESNKIYSFGYALFNQQIINPFRGKSRHFYGYFGRYRIVQNVSAVSPELVLIKKSFIKDLNGLDENYESLVSILDVCFKAGQVGKFVKLIPHELGELRRKSEMKFISENDLDILCKNLEGITQHRDRYLPEFILRKHNISNREV